MKHALQLTLARRPRNLILAILDCWGFDQNEKPPKREAVIFRALAHPGRVIVLLTSVGIFVLVRGFDLRLKDRNARDDDGRQRLRSGQSRPRPQRQTYAASLVHIAANN
jgi:hypothetical protein